MVRLSQHVISYLSLHLKNNNNLTVLLEISPKLKSKELCAPKGISEKELKKWSVIKALELLDVRKDTIAIQIINKAAKSKKDDFADTIVQIEALFSLFGLPLTVEPTVNVKLDKINLSKFVPGEVTPNEIKNITAITPITPITFITQQYPVNINLSNIKI